MSMEPRPFQRRLVAGYSDSFNARDVRPSSLMAFLEETAAEHCRSIGRDIFSLLEEGQGWVLAGGGLRMARYPRYGEGVRIETWISEWKRFSGIREYRILDADGKLLGEGGGRWVYWDMATRKPKAVPDDFRRRWHFDADSPYRRMYPSSTTPRFPEARTGTHPRRIRLTVRRGEVDLYGHLHNTTYLDWLMEAVPEAQWSGGIPMELGLRFFGEARLGDGVVFETTDSVKGWLHEVYRESDGRLLARGFSDWVERPTSLIA